MSRGLEKEDDVVTTTRKIALAQIIKEIGKEKNLALFFSNFSSD
jgi:hypothetical protein